MAPNRKPEAPDRDVAAPASSARLKAAGWALLRAFETYLVELLSAHRDTSRDQWIDQYHSPLGKRAHTRAVRDGALPGVKKGKKAFVRRGDLDEYLAHHAVRRKRAGYPASTERSLAVGEVAAQALEELGLELR